MSYIVSTDIETYLNITLTNNGLNTVNSLIPAVEEVIDNHCNRTWTTADNATHLTEKYDGGTDVFFLKKTPINQLVSVTIDGEPFDLDDVYNYDNYIKLVSRAAPGLQNVVVVYATLATPASLPVSVKQAVIQWVSELFKASPDAGKSVEIAQVGPMKLTYKLSSDDMPEFVRRALMPYVNLAL
jgi:hypothetical protein